MGLVTSVGNGVWIWKPPLSVTRSGSLVTSAADLVIGVELVKLLANRPGRYQKVKSTVRRPAITFSNQPFVTVSSRPLVEIGRAAPLRALRYSIASGVCLQRHLGVEI